MDITLTEQEARVLGCLIEKEMATPDYYPLSLNALINACNQKSNRDPVVSYNEETVIEALEGLRDKKLVRQSNLSRVAKYEQLFSDGANLVPQETAIICTLLVRGPQTVGEIRSRTERLSSFKNLDEVQQSLENLEEMRLVSRLPRQPGRKESRYANLLTEVGVTAQTDTDSPGVLTERAESSDRIADLQGQIDELRREIDEIKQAFITFTSQFE